MSKAEKRPSASAVMSGRFRNLLMLVSKNVLFIKPSITHSVAQRFTAGRSVSQLALACNARDQRSPEHQKRVKGRERERPLRAHVFTANYVNPAPPARQPANLTHQKRKAELTGKDFVRSSMTVDWAVGQQTSEITPGTIFSS